MSRLASLPVSLPATQVPDDYDIDALQVQFAMALSQQLSGNDMVAEAVWRDNYALTGTLRTFYGSEKVCSVWNATTGRLRVHSFKPVPQLTRKVPLPEGKSFVDMYFEFETAAPPELLCTVGLSLIYTRGGKWQIWVIKSVLDQLKQAPKLDTPPAKIEGRNGTYKPAYLDMKEYDCVIVGAGQAGLCTAAYCLALGLSYVVLEKNKRIGDNWRLRYQSARLHTIREYAHLPFERTFTADKYPEWLSKDHLAAAYEDWCERYGINVCLESSMDSGTWDAENQKWTLNVTKTDNGQAANTKLRCSFVVLAIGAGGQVPVYPALAGRESFKGTVMHSAAYDTPNAWTGKHGVVVGSANTAHDVAEDMVDAGLISTTMIQRQPTFVFPVEWYKIAQDLVYNAKVPTSLSDKLSFIAPHGVSRLIAMVNMHAKARADPERFEALQRVGFQVNVFGDPYWHLLERLGGHYMDVGASAKIAEGIIKVKSDAALTHYTSHGLGFSDGSEIPADLVVFATGFDLNIQNCVRELFGDEIADLVGPFSEVDKEGELIGAWKFKHPGLACNGGAIGPCRWYSRFLAFHMKAVVMGTPLVIYQDSPSNAGASL
ncbi:putative flavin-containing monooxygenase [Xylogone sp. PMI_703]|nr:putative flavin-containing monooxygenase [Xylogone sp. PMI_703]